MLYRQLNRRSQRRSYNWKGFARDGDLGMEQVPASRPPILLTVTVGLGRDRDLIEGRQLHPGHDLPKQIKGLRGDLPLQRRSDLTQIEKAAGLFREFPDPFLDRGTRRLPIFAPTSGGLIGQGEKALHRCLRTRGIQRLEGPAGLGDLNNKQQQKANKPPDVDRSHGLELDSCDTAAATSWVARPAIVSNQNGL
jgi:hypothetical protein